MGAEGALAKISHDDDDDDVDDDEGVKRRSKEKEKVNWDDTKGTIKDLLLLLYAAISVQLFLLKPHDEGFI